jgi:hypothetical protein
MEAPFSLKFGFLVQGYNTGLIEKSIRVHTILYLVGDAQQM